MICVLLRSLEGVVEEKGESQSYLVLMQTEGGGWITSD